ncbi:RNA pyrophosphohydrolase [Pelagibacterium montanilacus]|uniref:RNA pyrophosphohydrolase n=1 Tax=Pelagibacterium montanilacus TaxID=2185280 RepID=UPI000F8F8250|nr:RNA pyrophosphohydrolase [Pelagibacterium montanilacus]
MTTTTGTSVTESEKRASLPYRDCVGIALFSRAGDVFVARRITDGGPDTSEVASPWQMPQGGIDPGEDPLVAARRELLEETSVRQVRLLAAAPEPIFYDLPDLVLGVALGGRYRGQRQLWYALLHEGPESEIDLAVPSLPDCRPEFDAWRWERLEALPDLVVSFKRDAYRKVVEAFHDLPARIREAEGT